MLNMWSMFASLKKHVADDLTGKEGDKKGRTKLGILYASENEMEV